MLFFIASILISCEEEVIKNNYSGSYTSTVKKYSAMRMFTNGVEVNDNAKIQDFYLRRVGDPQAFVTDYTKDEDINGVKYLIIKDNKTICNFIVEMESRNFVDKGNKLYLETDRVFTSYNYLEQKLFFDKLYKNFPLYSVTTPLPSSSEYDSKTESKSCYYLNNKENIIEYPLISFFYLQLSENGGTMVSGENQNNEFNSNIITSLTINDTLLIQESRIILVKK